MKHVGDCSVDAIGSDDAPDMSAQENVAKACDSDEIFSIPDCKQFLS